MHGPFPSCHLILPGLTCLAGMASGVVVMDQIGDPSGYDLGNAGTAPPPTVSQIFPASPDSNSVALDDFLVTSEEHTLTRVEALFLAAAGEDNFNNVSGYRVSLFSSPGLAALSVEGDVFSALIPASAAAVTPIGDGLNALVGLDVDIPLPNPATYWIGVAPVAFFDVSGQFFLHHSGAAGPGTPDNGNGVFANPGGDIGFGTLYPEAGPSVDYAYRVTAVPEPIRVWLSLAGLALAGRRRRPRHRAILHGAPLQRPSSPDAVHPEPRPPGSPPPME